jgi:CheY-like chemotaxis protein
MDITSHGEGVSTTSQGFKEGETGHTPDPLKSRRTLLIAEDNEDTSLILRKWLETNGYDVVTTMDGWEAVQLVLHGHYDAILMDMSLPTMDGMSALRLIRAHG